MGITGENSYDNISKKNINEVEFAVRLLGTYHEKCGQNVHLLNSDKKLRYEYVLLSVDLHPRFFLAHR
jgi:hypothetical protein